LREYFDLSREPDLDDFEFLRAASGADGWAR
jgi:hypothetical protein